MHPREWPLWAWALLAVVVYPLGYELTVGAYTFSTAIALLAGCLLGRSDALRSQGMALAALMGLSLVGVVGHVSDWGYMAGRVAACLAASHLAGADTTRIGRQTVRWILLAMATVAALAASAWQEPWIGQQLKPYFNAVLVLAIIIAFFYALRLVAQPTRVLGLTASLAPYYAAGLSWATLSQRYLQSAGEVLAPVDLLFYGYVTHVPGDVLTAVAVAFITGPKQARHGEGSR